MNFAKFLRTLFFTEHLRWLLLFLIVRMQHFASNFFPRKFYLEFEAEAIKNARNSNNTNMFFKLSTKSIQNQFRQSINKGILYRIATHRRLSHFSVRFTDLQASLGKLRKLLLNLESMLPEIAWSASCSSWSLQTKNEVLYSHVNIAMSMWCQCKAEGMWLKTS